MIALEENSLIRCTRSLRITLRPYTIARELVLLVTWAERSSQAYELYVHLIVMSLRAPSAPLLRLDIPSKHL